MVGSLEVKIFKNKTFKKGYFVIVSLIERDALPYLHCFQYCLLILVFLVKKYTDFV